MRRSTTTRPSKHSSFIENRKLNYEIDIDGKGEFHLNDFIRFCHRAGIDIEYDLVKTDDP